MSENLRGGSRVNLKIFVVLDESIKLCPFNYINVFLLVFSFYKIFIYN